MPWKLEIHHIGLVTAGDATLIIASEIEKGPGDKTVVKQTKSVLIDGGFSTSGQTVHNYLIKTLPESANLNIIINTHYDKDHLGGISYLLAKNHICKETILYDLGIPGTISAIPHRIKDNNVTENYFKTEITYPSQGDIQNYFNKTGNDRIHPTKMVCSDQEIDIGKDPDNLMTQAGFLPGYKLVYQEILWASPTEPKGVYPGVLFSIGSKSFPSVPAPNLKSNPPEGNPPTIKCIAANGYIANYNEKGEEGAPKFVMTGMNTQADANGKSLAFLVNFGDFTYYIGGDLTSTVEDCLIDYIKKCQGKTFYMKASHHGSKESTSDCFLTNLTPKAVFISNGLKNQHRHPNAETIKRLASCKSVDNVYLTGPLPKYSATQDAPPVLSDEQKRKISPSAVELVCQRSDDEPLIAPVGVTNLIVTVDATGNAVTSFTVPEKRKPKEDTAEARAKRRSSEVSVKSESSQPRAEAAIRGAKA
jgi:beta-lactamase superfamily II metal-dependent hydrolase